MYSVFEEEHSTEGLTEDATDSAESVERRREEEDGDGGDDASAKRNQPSGAEAGNDEEGKQQQPPGADARQQQHIIGRLEFRHGGGRRGLAGSREPGLSGFPAKNAASGFQARLHR